MPINVCGVNIIYAIEEGANELKKNTLSFRSLPADFHGKFFPLYFLKDKMLACKDIYLEGSCGKFSVTNTFQ